MSSVLTFASTGAITISSNKEGTFAMYFYFELVNWPTIQSNTNFLTVKFVHPCRNSTLNNVSIDTTYV